MLQGVEKEPKEPRLKAYRYFETQDMCPCIFSRQYCTLSQLLRSYKEALYLDEHWWCGRKHYGNYPAHVHRSVGPGAPNTKPCIVSERGGFPQLAAAAAAALPLRGGRQQRRAHRRFLRRSMAGSRHPTAVLTLALHPISYSPQCQGSRPADHGQPSQGGRALSLHLLPFKNAAPAVSKRDLHLNTGKSHHHRRKL